MQEPSPSSSNSIQHSCGMSLSPFQQKICGGKVKQAGQHGYQLFKHFDEGLGICHKDAERPAQLHFVMRTVATIHEAAVKHEETKAAAAISGRRATTVI